jgi:acyl carrier protein|tara:strand:+ start:1912 stop:2154 length:243 start_codon:yes stop_codon:yes gene_type:complete
MELTVKQKVYEIIARKLKKQVSDLEDTINLKKDLGADSIDTVEIVFEVEEFYKISVPDEYAETIHTIGDAVKVVEELASK